MSKSRYEREIEEILSKYDEESGRAQKTARQEKPKPDLHWTPPPAYSPRSQKPKKQQFSLPNWKRFSAAQYMLAAFAVAMLSVLLSRILPPSLVTFMLIVAVGLFLVPIVLYYRSGTSSGGWSPPREEKRWRGQVIDFNTRRDVTNDPLASVKRWLKRR